ncbi:sigma-54-dependent Fis family transcriptional regulator [Marinomonas piezotolerans]|uniref:Sigma-54-dependent Fis family transcriptional regulator n=1 Tax=Marinomonas piezotolerans TaxID=2213058 RepID=A0A370U8H6_9GAMM|nr:sigma-54 dependent transcriptional regulator [Marinomonas piezotolerans]RDL44096.1 sigma-54-dependent Fis family transcriptional regulator [Marinomonas piezotolerans]
MYHVMLICEDNSPLKDVDRWLSRNGFHVNVSKSLEQANKYYELEDFEILLIDAAQTSRDTLNSIQQRPYIIFDRRPSLNAAIDYMAGGADYFIPLPTDSDTVLAHVIDVLEKQKNKSTSPNEQQTSGHVEPSIRLFDQLDTADSVPLLGTPESGIIGSSEAMRVLFDELNKVARTDATVLIHGESGTGKELVAKSIHNLSKRAEQPLISVNCAAIPENLIESELFGHEKGAFTGAVSARDGLIVAADNGTLFLDEIGELPLEAQARLLRVLQEGEIRRVGAVSSTKVNIRLVTATHRNLLQMVKNGMFREDLYYRLYVMELSVPALRDREHDISEIARILLKKACTKHDKPLPQYTKAFDKAILSHTWPGNVRELENAIERAVILSPDGKLEASNLKLKTKEGLPDKPSRQPSPSHPQQTNDQFVIEGTTLDDYLKHFVLTHQHKMTETQLAQSLGISRKSLWERRQKLGIPKKVTE